MKVSLETQQHKLEKLYKNYSYSITQMLDFWQEDIAFAWWLHKLSHDNQVALHGNVAPL